MTDSAFDVLSPQMKVMKCKGGIIISFLAESSGKFCILFTHRILNEQKGSLSFEQPASLLAHLADCLLGTLESAFYPDENAHQQEWFSSQEDALIAVREMWN